MIGSELDKIEYGIKTNKDIDYFENIYNNVFNLVRWTAITMENSVFYRARLSGKTQLFSHICELKYPPCNKIKQRGRLNEIGESVAYLSTGELSPIAELDIDFYQIFCLAEIEYYLKDILFFCIGLKADYSGLTRDETDFINFFNNLLTSPNEDYYPATIAFAHKIFNRGAYNGLKKLRTGIAYNSAQEYKTNKTLHNIAVEPHTFDACFKIIKATYQIMSFNPNDDSIILNDINYSQISNNGKIIWERSYEDMISYCDFLFDKDIFFTVNEKGENFMIKYPEGSGKIDSVCSSYNIVDFKNLGKKSIKK